jgi:hypothetical protein
MSLGRFRPGRETRMMENEDQVVEDVLALVRWSQRRSASACALSTPSGLLGSGHRDWILIAGFHTRSLS